MTSTEDLRPTDHTGLRVMGIEECLERMARVPVGRLAFELDGEICVLPVNHILKGVDICFRTAGSSKLEAAVSRDTVAYEVDQFDARAHTGWSVLVQGTALVVDDDEDLRSLEHAAPRSWVAQHTAGYRWVRVRGQSITGRELC